MQQAIAHIRVLRSAGVIFKFAIAPAVVVARLKAPCACVNRGAIKLVAPNNVPGERRGARRAAELIQRAVVNVRGAVCVVGSLMKDDLVSNEHGPGRRNQRADLIGYGGSNWIP